MILTDVDGTLTDGSLAVLPDGEEIKSYHVKDGLGVLLAQLAGLKIGHHHRQNVSKGLERRAERLKIDELHQGVIDKRPVFEEILARHGLRPEEVAYIGDDFGRPRGPRSRSAWPAAVGRRPSRRPQAGPLSSAGRAAGDGAFREFVDFIIGAQKKWGVVDGPVPKSLRSENLNRPTSGREDRREDQSEHLPRIRHPRASSTRT